MKQQWILFSLLTSLSCSSAMLWSNAPAQNEVAQAATSRPQNTQQQSKPQPSSQPRNIVLASALPALDDGVGIIITGEWLYWKTREEGLTYGLRSPASYTPVGGDFLLSKGVKGTPQEMSPNFSSGYRVGADFELPHGGWDLYFSWTGYWNNHTNSLTNKGDRVIWPYFINANGTPVVTGQISSKFHLDYNVMDLGLGCAFHPRQDLTVRPFAGFRAGWIHQKFTLQNTGILSIETGGTLPSIRDKNYNNFQGYGMRMGFDVAWTLGYGFSLVSNMSGSLLWSQFDLKQFERNANLTPRSHVEDKIQRITPVFDMFAGVEWETDFDGESFYLNLHAGWEQQIWFSQNQVQTFPIATNPGYGDRQQGDLYLYGLTLGASFGF